MMKTAVGMAILLSAFAACARGQGGVEVEARGPLSWGKGTDSVEIEVIARNLPPRDEELPKMTFYHLRVVCDGTVKDYHFSTSRLYRIPVEGRTDREEFVLSVAYFLQARRNRVQLLRGRQLEAQGRLGIGSDASGAIGKRLLEAEEDLRALSDCVAQGLPPGSSVEVLAEIDLGGNTIFDNIASSNRHLVRVPSK